MSFEIVLRLVTSRLRTESAAVRLMTKTHELERRYSPEQPRVPAGTPEGGQWTGGLGGNDAATGRPPVAGGRVTFSGYLIGKGTDEATGSTYCLYFDSREQYTFRVAAEPGGYCPPIRLRY